MERSVEGIDSNRNHEQNTGHGQEQQNSVPTTDRIVPAERPDMEVDDDDGIIYLKNGILKPQNARILEAARSRLSSRPPGCRTIIIRKIQASPQLGISRLEAVLRDIFTVIGGPVEYCRIRSSRTWAAEVRFQSRDSVDKAVAVNGYTLMIPNGLEPAIRFTMMMNFLPSRQDEKEQKGNSSLSAANAPEIPVNPENTVRLFAKFKECKDAEALSSCIDTFRSWLRSNSFNENNLECFDPIVKVLWERVQRIRTVHHMSLREITRTAASVVKKLKLMLNETEQIEHIFRNSDRDVFNCKTMIDEWSTQAKDMKTELPLLINAIQNEPYVLGAHRNMAAKHNEQVVDAKLQQQQRIIERLQKRLHSEDKKSRELDEKMKKASMALDQFQVNEDQQREWNSPKRPRLSNDMEEGDSQQLDTIQARILCLVTSFLRSTPDGASVELLQSFLKCHNIKIEGDEITAIFTKFPELFHAHNEYDNGERLEIWRMELEP